MKEQERASFVAMVPPEFVAGAEKLSPLHRALVVDNVDPSSITVKALMKDLRKEFTHAEAMKAWMKASSRPFASFSVQQALSPGACAALRDAVDRNRRTTPDSVDECPEHSLVLANPHEDLAELIGMFEYQRLLRLPREYLQLAAAHRQQRQQRRQQQRQQQRQSGQRDEQLQSFEPFMPHLRRQMGCPDGDNSVAEEGTHDADDSDDSDDSDAADTDADLVVTLEQAFVRRYSHDTRPYNPFHQDRFALTINVALSADDDHGGGCLLGVWNGQIARIERAEGEATMHSSELVHAVTMMTHGVRYSLILFLSTRPRPAKRG